MTWGVDRLTVKYGPTIALDDVTMSVEPGVVHGVVGGDGAGKTTLLRVLAGLDLGHEGSVLLPGFGRTGYVPPDGGVFADLTVDENLDFVADAYRLSGWRPRAAELIERAGLSSFGDRLAGHLSGGQRRKLAGSLALLPEPDLLVLDEVTTGVDPVSRVGLWRLVSGAAAAGAAVVISTSYLDEAERVGRVLLLHDGRVMANGSPTELIDLLPGSVTFSSAPRNRSRAWRHGRRWREWNPDGDRMPGGRPTLEDFAIVSELSEREGSR